MLLIAEVTRKLSDPLSLMDYLFFMVFLGIAIFLVFAGRDAIKSRLINSKGFQIKGKLAVAGGWLWFAGGILFSLLIVAFLLYHLIADHNV